MLLKLSFKLFFVSDLEHHLHTFLKRKIFCLISLKETLSVLLKLSYFFIAHSLLQLHKLYCITR